MYLLAFSLGFLGLLCWGYLRYKRLIATDPTIGPQPPTVKGKLPFIGAGIDWLKNPKEFLNQKRKEVGDVFVLEAFGLHLFFVFSPTALDDFYHVPESHASFLEATRAFLGYKVPAEVMRGEMPTIQKVLRRDFQVKWLEALNNSIARELSFLSESGKMDVFKWTKQVMHRTGFSVWIGPEAIEDDKRTLQRLITSFDQIDPEQGFQDMSSLLYTVLSRRSKEKQALRELVSIVSGIVEARRGNPKNDFLEAMFDEFSSFPKDECALRATCSIVAIHMASQSNLFAAVAWTIVNLLQYPEHLAIVKREIEEHKIKHGDSKFVQHGDEGLEHLEKCYHESIRLAQQSLTLRLVSKPVKLEGYTVVKGYYIATLLSCLNTDNSILRDADQFDPSLHYLRNGKLNAEAFQAKEDEYAISTFGHSVHQCPGKRFAITAAKTVIAALLDTYDLTPIFGETGVKILDTQIGAVGRPTQSAFVRYEKK